MNRKRFLFGIYFVLALGGCLVLVYRTFVLSSILAHQGDGTFQDLSHYAGPIPVRGYAISMPEFDMGKPFQAEYHVSRLPRIGISCGMYLAIRADEPHSSPNTRRPEGMLELELFDSHDRRIAVARGGLGEFEWWGIKDIYVLYHPLMNNSLFEPDPDESYRLRVTFKPQTELAGRKAFVYLRCGGSM